MTRIDPPKDHPTGALRRIGEALLALLGVFVVLEPIWMLLPFAGFLYGSVFRIQNLSQNPDTAWLTHFVFPVLTLGPLGPILVGLGLLLFVVGAVQIYGAKLRRSGLVTTGLYRFVRHPQYVSLTFFGVGILLSWGRAIAFLSFTAMMFLYYHLARREEARCISEYGDEYERYRGRTSFVLPGDRALRGLAARMPGRRLPAFVRVIAGLALTLAASYGAMLLVVAVKEAVRTVPYLMADIVLDPVPWAGGVEITAGEAAGVPFVTSGRTVVARGPWRNGAVTGFAERVLLRLPESEALAGFLKFLGTDERDRAVVFVLPWEEPETRGPPADPERRGPPPDPGGPDRVRLMIFRVRLDAGAEIGDTFADAARMRIRGAAIAPVNLGRPEGKDLVEGEVFRPGPMFPGEARWRAVVEQFANRPDADRLPSPAVDRPGGHGPARLVLVEAPILRTRLDPPFAREILDRLLASARFHDRLTKAGVGGDLVPVAFPRPGPNWYREHHGKPEISVFVVLVRLHGGAGPEAGPENLDRLFVTNDRDLVGAFTAEVDFAAAPDADGVGEIATIGPRRDLEERWRFFLSGL